MGARFGEKPDLSYFFYRVWEKGWRPKMSLALMNGTVGNYTLWLANESVCAQVDDALSQAIDMRDSGMQEVRRPTTFVVPIVIMLAAIPIAFAGSRILRVSSALVAAIFAFSAVYGFVRATGQDVSCSVSLSCAGVAAMMAALSTGCLFKAALFFLGAAAAASTIHLVFASFPELHAMGDQPMLAHRSFAYWGLMLVSGIGGGLLMRRRSKPVLEIVTAFIGGTGVAYGLHGINEVALTQLENWVFVGIGGAVAIAGVLVQRRLRLRGCKKSEARAQVGAG